MKLKIKALTVIQSTALLVGKYDIMYYLGLDCSTKAIHGVLLDEEENIVEQFKWGSSASNYEDRFYEILTGFEQKLSKIDIGELLVAVEAAIYIQNPKTTVALAAVVAGLNISVTVTGTDVCLSIIRFGNGGYCKLVKQIKLLLNGLQWISGEILIAKNKTTVMQLV